MYCTSCTVYTQWFSYCYSTTYQDPVAAVTVVKSTTTLSQHKALQQWQLEMCVLTQLSSQCPLVNRICLTARS